MWAKLATQICRGCRTTQAHGSLRRGSRPGATWPTLSFTSVLLMLPEHRRTGLSLLSSRPTATCFAHRATTAGSPPSAYNPRLPISFLAVHLPAACALPLRTLTENSHAGWHGAATVCIWVSSGEQRPWAGRLAAGCNQIILGPYRLPPSDNLQHTLLRPSTASPRSCALSARSGYAIAKRNPVKNYKLFLGKVARSATALPRVGAADSCRKTELSHATSTRGRPAPNFPPNPSAPLPSFGRAAKLTRAASPKAPALDEAHATVGTTAARASVQFWQVPGARRAPQYGTAAPGCECARFPPSSVSSPLLQAAFVIQRVWEVAFHFIPKVVIGEHDVVVRVPSHACVWLDLGLFSLVKNVGRV